MSVNYAAGLSNFPHIHKGNCGLPEVCFIFVLVVLKTFGVIYISFLCRTFSLLGFTFSKPAKSSNSFEKKPNLLRMLRK